MTRSTPEWIGGSDDEAVPIRVRLRVYFAANGKCAECGRKPRAGEKPECDHVIAICNGGQNRESNLQNLCGWCHAQKTRADVGEKSLNRRVQSKNLGLHRPKGRPMPGTRASGIRKRMDGRVERR